MQSKLSFKSYFHQQFLPPPHEKLLETLILSYIKLFFSEYLPNFLLFMVKRVSERNFSHLKKLGNKQRWEIQIASFQWKKRVKQKEIFINSRSWQREGKEKTQVLSLINFPFTLFTHFSLSLLKNFLFIFSSFPVDSPMTFLLLFHTCCFFLAFHRNQLKTPKLLSFARAGSQCFL